MKLAAKIALLVGVVCLLTLNSGCKKKDPEPPSVTDQQIEILTKSEWSVTVAELDGVSQMADYGSFKMTISGSKGQKTIDYSTTGRTGTKYPWAQHGSFTFSDTNPATTLSRDDGVSITFSATATQLQMSFNYSGPGFNARTGIVTGAWTFTFTH